jgi:hypothetical protein
MVLRLTVDFDEFVISARQYLSVIRMSARKLSAPIFLSLVIAWSSQAAAAGWQDDCSDCGPDPGDDVCYDAVTPVLPNTGKNYYTQILCPEACNGAGECNTKTCSVSVTTGDKTKYVLAGGIGPSYFSLSTGWENEKTHSAGCDFSDSCATENCCVGPAYAYLVYDYQQRYKGYWNSTTEKFCKPCASPSWKAVGTLETFAYGECSEILRGDSVPGMDTKTSLCSGLNS